MFWYNGSTYVEVNGSLAPVQLAHKKSNGTVESLFINPDAEKAEITPQGFIKTSSGTLIDPFSVVPGKEPWWKFWSQQQLSRREAAEILLASKSTNNSNRQIKTTNVVVTRSNNETSIPIKNLNNTSKAMIVGTNITEHVDALVAILKSQSNTAKNSGLNLQNAISKISSLKNQASIEEFLKSPFGMKLYSFIMNAKFTTNGTLVLQNGASTNMTNKETQIFKILFSNQAFMKHIHAISNELKRFALPPGTRTGPNEEKKFTFFAIVTFLTLKSLEAYKTYKTVQAGAQVVQALAAGNPAAAAPIVALQLVGRVTRALAAANPAAAAIVNSNALNRLIKAGKAIR